MRLHPTIYEFYISPILMKLLCCTGRKLQCLIQCTIMHSLVPLCPMSYPPLDLHEAQTSSQDDIIRYCTTIKSTRYYCNIQNLLDSFKSILHYTVIHSNVNPCHMRYTILSESPEFGCLSRRSCRARCPGSGDCLVPSRPSEA